MPSLQVESALSRLPQELLERIVELANPGDLLALRAVSSEFKKKMSHSFNKNYIKSRTYFVLDPARVDNLQSIISTPALLRELKSLTLSVAPLYPSVAADIHLAAGNGTFAHSIAQEKAAALLVLTAEDLHWMPMDHTKIGKILQNLKSTGKCQLSLVLNTHTIYGTYEDFGLSEGSTEGATSGPIRGTIPLRPSSTWSIAYQDLLSVVAKWVGYEVTNIRIDDRQLLEMHYVGAAEISAIQRSMRALKSMHVAVSSVVLAHHDHHANTLRDERYSQIQRLLLGAAEELETLKIVGDIQTVNFCCDRSFQPDVLNVGALLLARPLSCLVELSLEHISVAESVLFRTLSDCGTTLRSISISDVVIDATSWRGIFIQMRKLCSLLAHINFEGLVTRQPRSEYIPTVFDFDARLKRLHGPPIDPYFDDGVFAYWQEYHKLEIHGRAEVQKKLEALCTGEEYREAEFSNPNVTSETFKEWEREGRGSADCFGIENLVELCARAKKW